MTAAAPSFLNTGNGPRALPPPAELVIDGASAFTEIPVIDLQEGKRDPIDLAQEVRDACLHVGFFYVKNHGVPQDIIDATLAAGKRFFALPVEEKKKLDIKKSDNYKGYTGIMSANADPANQGDLYEGFDLGWEGHDEGVMRGGNVWPEQLPEFRKKVMEYYNAVLDLGKRLFPVFADSLSLPTDFFSDKIQKPAAIMRLLHYPPQTGIVDDRVLGIGAHSDFECFTILYQDEVPALQVLNAEGKWLSAPHIPGTFVINLGDQFARWTNDVYVSTVHRAINRTGAERYSIPFFFGTDYDVKLEALPSCVSDDRPAHYDVITAGEYVKWRLERTYGRAK